MLYTFDYECVENKLQTRNKDFPKSKFLIRKVLESLKQTKQISIDCF